MCFINKLLKKENLLVIILSGILLMIIALPTGKRETKPSATMSLDSLVEDTQAVEYETKENSRDSIEELEEDLEKLLTECKGVGEVKVLINGYKDNKKLEITGLLIAAKGAGNENVAKLLSEVGQALFGLDEDSVKVAVLTGNK